MATKRKAGSAKKSGAGGAKLRSSKVSGAKGRVKGANYSATPPTSQWPNYVPGGRASTYPAGNEPDWNLWPTYVPGANARPGAAAKRAGAKKAGGKKATTKKAAAKRPAVRKSSAKKSSARKSSASAKKSSSKSQAKKK